MKEVIVAVPSQSAKALTWEQPRRNIRYPPILLSVFTFVLGLIYLAVIPSWAGPDEPRHYEYVRLLNDKNRLVSWSDVDAGVMREIIRSMDDVNYWKWGVSLWRRSTPGELPTDFGQIYRTAHQLHQPPLAYLLYLVPFKLVAQSSVAAQLYAMRLLSILLNVVVVLAAYVTGRELFRDDPSMALALPVFVMLLPQHLFLHSIVMNDHLAEAALAWMFALIVRTFRLGLALPRALGSMLCLAIGLAAKRTALYGVPILVFAFLVYIWIHWGRGRLTSTQRSSRLALTLIGASLTLVVFSYVWQWISANDPQLQDYIVRLFLFLPTEQFPFQLDARVIQPAAFALYASYLKNMFITTWGHFGWVNITLGVQVYWGFAALAVVSLVGLGLFAVRDFQKLHSWQRATLVVFAVSGVIAVITVIALQIRLWDVEWPGGPHGRYLFPVLIPLATPFLLGLRAFFPRTQYGLWFGLFSGGMLVYNLVALIFFIIPFYRA
ncbi:MAG: hypothetical protein HY741_01865 [Chloroflexi bacterium]|nr:hypothetical protein [Chloroflexota bacterium]